ncbi:MAG: squalene/phytoene synthase family protein, partial [Rhodospirillales bacterium]|nr:squalene/phytoene synthase family protein [Rhodospirillales bacterium]
MDQQKSMLVSGKTAKDENFPVGSFLLPAWARPHVAAYYRFARTADDIADHPTLPSDQKVAGLKAMGEALVSG